MVLIKRLFTIMSCFALCVAGLGQENLNLNLKQCIAYAEEHNLTLQSAALDVSTSEIHLTQAKMQMTPTVTAGIGQNFGYSHGNNSFNMSGNYNVNAGLTLFNGLTIRNTIKQSKLQLTQAELQAEQAKNQVRINIIRSYLSILMNQEMLDYQQNVLSTSRSQLEQGEQRYKVGQILESDYLLLQSQYYSDSVNIENLLIAIDNEYVTLRNLLALEPNQNLTITTPDSNRLAQVMILPDLNEVISKTMDYLPELKIKSNNVQIAEYDVKIAKGGYYPSISLSTGIGTGYNAMFNQQNKGITNNLLDNLNESLGLNISIPIYKQGSVRNNVKLKEIQYDQANLALEQVEKDVRQEVEKYYLDVKKAFNDYNLSEIQKQAYYSNFLAYNQKFQYGAITAVDLLQQQTNYLNILNTYMQNKYNFLLQKKVLDVYTGQPIEL